MIGTSLNQYQITASIGAGGMGEVFRARDTRLNRDVAVKVLPRDFAADADRQRRFEQEAKTLAALNHPNILTIHDAGVHEGTPYLVSELLRGQTLREMLGNTTTTALPVRKAIDYALQIAQGLAAAHVKGIIHRDLKPENIFVTQDGRVKILDFGLAKLRANPQSEIPNPKSAEAATIRIDADAILNTTQPGMVLGTPAYMAPEQVRGEPADHRADIFAFGAVLYEMLSGTRAFKRNSAVASMHAVISEEPAPLSASNVHVPPALERIVQRCLEKQAGNRFQSAKDLAFALESTTWLGMSNPQSGRSPQIRGLSRSRITLAAMAALIVLCAAFAAGRWQQRRPEAPAVNWHGQRLGGPSIAFRPIASPDGKELAFVALERGVTQLGVMIADSGNWRVLTTNRTLGNVGSFCWSLDGTELFHERWSGVALGVLRISKYGGEERMILEKAETPQVLPDGSLLVLRSGTDRFLRLHRYWLGDQRLEPLNAITGYSQFGVPYHVLPGGKEVIFHGWPAESSNSVAAVWILDLRSGHCELLNANPPKRILEWASSPLVPNPRDNSILSVETVGDAYRIVRRTRQNYPASRTLLSLTLAPISLDVASDGSLYVDQVERPVEILRFLDSNTVERVALSASYEIPDFLPLPGGRLLLSSRAAGQHRLVTKARGQEAVPLLLSKQESREPMAMLGQDRILCRVGSSSNWVVSIVSLAEGRVIGQLNSIPADGSLRALASAPDGKTIYFVSAGSVWSVAVDGGDPKRIRAGDGVAPYPGGEYLLVQVNDPEANRLIQMPLSGAPERILPTEYPLTGKALSPNAIGSDGRIVVQVALPDSWYWPAAILDPQTGKMELLPEDKADMKAPAWDDQGQIVVAAVFVRSSLWRFRPEN